MNPRLSVIGPIYNVEAYLTACLTSLVEQDADGMEIIAVNDGSPDSCGEILSDFAARYPEKIRVFDKENGGLSDARNFGLRHARGEYVAFLDGDDAAEPHLYAALLKKAEETGADAVACPICYVWEDGRRKTVPSGVPAIAEHEALRRVYCRFYPAVWNKLYRRSVLEEAGVWFKKDVWFEDVEFSHRLFPYFRKIAAIDGPCVLYRQREGSITASVSPKLFDYLENWKSIVSFYEERGLFAAWEKELEYAAARYLLATFLSRAARLPDGLYPKAVSESLAFLNAHFPAWRKNPYFFQSGVRGLYLRFFSPALCRLIARRNKV